MQRATADFRARRNWMGCSTGGRQGLKEAQRFPDDYDGISAGAPANNWVPLMASAVLMQQQLADPTDGWSPAKLSLLQEAALAACDTADGVEDRVINEPSACSFDPGTFQCAGDDAPDCLTPRQVEAARTIYRGVIDTRTGAELFPGPEVGSEPEWFAFRPALFPIGANYWRDLVMGDSRWDLSTFDIGADVERGLSLDTAEMTTTDPDLSAFVSRGGKLLLWHGWTDGLIAAQNTINYYDEVLTTLGTTDADDSVRLFMLPGVNHCSGGEGAFQADYLGVLNAWVEQGQVPNRIIASRPLEDGGERTRPLCAYPEVARYTGTGSTDRAENFGCGPATTP